MGTTNSERDAKAEAARLERERKHTLPELVSATLNANHPKSVLGRFCCKSRKSNNPKNLAKVDLWTSLPLRRFSTPLPRSVIDFR